MVTSLTSTSTKVKVVILLHRESSIILLSISLHHGLFNIVSCSLIIYMLPQPSVVIFFVLASTPVVPLVLTVKVFPLISRKPRSHYGQANTGHGRVDS